jgi:phage recombination protein Bet
MVKAKEKDSAETEPKEKKSTDIVSANKQEVKKPQYNDAQVRLIANTVAKGATADELKLFMIIAHRTGLDPFTKQIHFVKRRSKDGEVGTIQVGIDGFRAIAQRGGGYAGSDDVIYDSEENAHPNKASVTVYKIIQGVRVPFVATARWKEYCPPAPNNFMWNKMPYLMLGKVAEALALRKAFPNDLSGIYVEEEMERAAVITDPSSVTVETPKKIETSTPDKPEKPSALDNLYAAAREFGAKEGEESLFIQERLDIDVNWPALDDSDIAKLKTQLMAKCVQNGVPNAKS